MSNEAAYPRQLAILRRLQAGDRLYFVQYRGLGKGINGYRWNDDEFLDHLHGSSVNGLLARRLAYRLPEERSPHLWVAKIVTTAKGDTYDATECNEQARQR